MNAAGLGASSTQQVDFSHDIEQHDSERVREVLGPQEGSQQDMSVQWSRIRNSPKQGFVVEQVKMRALSSTGTPDGIGPTLFLQGRSRGWPSSGSSTTGLPLPSLVSS